jgi:hypothetical protein
MNRAPYGVLLSPQLARLVREARSGLEWLRMCQVAAPTVDELLADKQRAVKRDSMRRSRLRANGAQPA